jgi:hypothetical protein
MGTIDDIQRRIADLAAVDLQELIITPVTDDARQLELLATHVIGPFGSTEPRGSLGVED